MAGQRPPAASATMMRGSQTSAARSSTGIRSGNESDALLIHEQSVSPIAFASMAFTRSRHGSTSSVRLLLHTDDHSSVGDCFQQRPEACECDRTVGGVVLTCQSVVFPTTPTGSC